MYEKVPQLQYGHGGVQIVRQPARLQDYPRIDVFFSESAKPLLSLSFSNSLPLVDWAYSLKQELPI